MTCRAQAALWIVCVIAALGILPGACESPAALRQLQARTEALYGLIDPRAERVALSLAGAAGRGGSRIAGDEIAAANRLPGRASFERVIARWVAWWRIVLVRVLLLAGAMVGGLPLVVAGAVDGMAMRRARPPERAAGSPFAAALGGHVLVALLFAPLLWCALPISAGPWSLALWLVATAAAVAFTLSQAPGIDAR